MMKRNVLLRETKCSLNEIDCSVKGNTLFCLAKHLLFAYLLLNQNNFSMFATLFMKNMTFV